MAWGADDLTLEMKRIVPAAPSVVFTAFSDALEVAPPVRLAYTFVWEEPDPDDVENSVGLSFRHLDESTEVVLMQGPFKTPKRRTLHCDGWMDAFDRLERLVSPQA